MHLRLSHPVRLLALTLSLLATTGAWSQAAADASRARYEAERRACLAGLTGQDLSTCLTEASNAYGERQRGAEPGVSEDTLLRNRLRRCEVHQGDERADCEARMRGQGQTSGSVDGGGVLRELTTVVPPAQ